jgi:large exoprotein involved in heme utilization and adhesion
MVVRVQHASLLEGATIKTLTGAADPNAPAAATVTVQGLQGAGSMADSVTLSGLGSGIVSETTGSARSGHVTVESNAVSLTDRAVIQTGTLGNTGSGGDVTINAGSVDFFGGSRISSLSSAENAGHVQITAVGTVSFSNEASINSSTSSTGRAGDITMNVGSLTLSNHSEITNSSSGVEAGAGEAGNITIQSGSTVVLNNSSITTEANEASGGQITINAPEMIRLTNSEVSTSVKGITGNSDGGNISIDPQFFILQNSQLTAQANAGAGGAINVIAGVFLADPGTLVSATSASGPQGTVNIQSPVQNIGGELTPMSDEFSSALALLAQQCAARVADGMFSTFVITGHEGLPAEPGGFLASPSWVTGTVSGTISAAKMVPDTLFPPVTGLFQNYDGRPIHVARIGGACRKPAS